MKHEKLVCFDLDGTLTDSHSWERLNMALGMTLEQDAQLYQSYTRGDISYDEWMQRIIASYTRSEETHEQIVEALFSETLLRPGAISIVKEIKALGYLVVIVSGTFDRYIAQVARELEVDTYRACTRIVFDDAGYVSGFEHSGDEAQAKLQLLQEIATQQELALDQCVCVGDGANDLELFAATGKGVAFTNTPAAEKAWKVVESLEDVPSVL